MKSSHPTSRCQSLILFAASLLLSGCGAHFAERQALVDRVFISARQAGVFTDMAAARSRVRVVASFPHSSECGRDTREYTEQEQARAGAAVALLERVLQSEAFSNRVANSIFVGDNEQGSDSANGDLGFNPHQILAMLLSGADQRDGAADYTIQLPLCISTGNEVGHTNEGPSWITYTSAGIVQNYSPGYLAGHYLHEHMHRIGFWHTRSRTATRPWSIPYSVGIAACELAAQFTDLSAFPNESCRDDGRSIQRYSRACLVAH